MARLAIVLFGAPRFELDATPLHINLRKAVALLAYLAVTGTPHTRDALAAVFWPEADQEHARGALRYTLAQLRTALGDGWLQITREQIGLNAHSDLTIDVVQAEELLAQARSHDHPPLQACAKCVPLLEQAVALQRGTLLAGFTLPDSPAFDDWLFFESERLQHAQVDAYSKLVAYHRAAGTGALAIPYVQRWLALNPLQEEVNQLLIELFIESNQHAAARRQYAILVKLLREELAVEPTQAISEMIGRLGAEREVGATWQAPAMPLQSPAVTRTAWSLPTPATQLIGRAHEIDAIGLLLDDPSCRLLTLLGAGGSGKTRMALAVAEARLARSSAAVVFVPLAALTTPHALVSTVASAVGCSADAGDLQQRLRDFLRDKRYLILLDNLEHLLEGDNQADHPGAVVTLLDDLLQSAPGVQLLVTSRKRLQLYEEQLYIVQGLHYPEWDAVEFAESYSAVQLFLQRAHRVASSFELTPANTRAVIQIVRLLAGQPLAIELAATWVRTLTPAEIAGELRTGIDLLESEMRNVPARQRSMRATYAFSWEQLRPDERIMQQSLALFRGGFTRAAALEVAGATPRALQRLIDQSLLASSSSPGHGLRYELHELLRQYAAEHLAQDPAQAALVRTRHAGYYLKWAAAQSKAMIGPQREATLAEVQIELENVQAAWATVNEERNLALMDAGLDGLCEFHRQRSRLLEGISVCEQAIAWLDDPQLLGSAAITLARALAWLGAFTIEIKQLQQAQQFLERSLQLLPANHDTLRAFVYYSLGRAAFLGVSLAPAQDWFERSLALYRALGDQVGAGQTLSMLGRLGWIKGDYPQAYRYYEQCRATYRALNDLMGSIHSISELAMISVLIGQHETATQLFEQGEALSRTLTDPLEIAQAGRHLGNAFVNVGRNVEAQAQYERSVAIAAASGSHAQRVEDSLMLGFAHLMQQNYDQVTALMQEVFSTSQAMGLMRSAGFALTLLGHADLGRGAYVRARTQFEQCLAGYQLRSTADDQIFTQLGLSEAYRALNKREQAQQVAIDALQEAVNNRSVRAGRWALAAYFGVLLDRQEIVRAIEVEATLRSGPVAQHTPFYTSLLTQRLRDHIAGMPSAVVEAARIRGRARSVRDTVNELLAGRALVKTLH